MIFFALGDPRSPYTTLAWKFISDRICRKNDKIVICHVRETSKKGKKGGSSSQGEQDEAQGEKPSAYIVRSEIGGPWTIDQLDEEGFDFLMPTMKQEIDEKFPDAVIAEIEPAPGASVARALIDYSDQLEDISCVVMGARNQRFPKKRDVPMHAGSVAATFAELSFAKSVLIVRTAPGIVVPRWETSRYPFPVGKRNVVVAIDGSDTSHRLVKHMTENILWPSDTVTLAYSPVDTLTAEEDVNAWAEVENCRRILARALSNADEQVTSAVMNPVRRASSSLVEFIGRSRQGSYDFIVLATQTGEKRHRPNSCLPARKKVSGGTTRDVMHKANIPVMVVRQRVLLKRVSGSIPPSNEASPLRRISDKGSEVLRIEEGKEEGDEYAESARSGSENEAEDVATPRYEPRHA